VYRIILPAWSGFIVLIACHRGLAAEGAPATAPATATATATASAPTSSPQTAPASAPTPPRDQRFTTFRHGKAVYEFPSFASPGAWNGRAAELRRHVLAATGLWPTPTKYSLNMRIFDMKIRPDYTVSKVYFESHPDFYVTGNLYRPSRILYTGPGVLCPHGHWKTGRLADEELGSVPGRCINLARMGCIVLTYDMIGYNDSLQLSHDFKGARQDLWGINLMGLQLWDSIRAVDALASLPDVDPARIGCTGASGGGTQTFMLTAVDDRVTCSAPVKMISAHFQGGCLCENAPLLRINTYNVEIGACMAPRPLLMVSATGDWTKNTPTVEYPAIAGIYKLLGAPDKIHQVQIDAPHNYNKASREAVYAWFGKHLLGNPDASKFKEEPFKVEADADLRVFSGKEDLPYRAATPESLTTFLIRKAKDQIADAKPISPDSLKALRDSLGSTLKHCLNVTLPAADQLVVLPGPAADVPGGKQTVMTVGRKTVGDAVPAVLWLPPQPGESATVVVHEKGLAALMTPDAKAPGPFVAALLAKASTVLTIDAFETGRAVSTPEEQKKKNEIPYFTTFNPTVLADRVQDVLTALAVLQHRPGIKRVDLVGLGDAGLWVLLARSQSGLPGRTVVDAAKLDYNDDQVFEQRFFCPVLRRAGDFATAMALCAPGPLFVHNQGKDFPVDWARSAFPSQDQTLVAQTDPASDDQVIAWLTK
jgi:hypothetical protein